MLIHALCLLQFTTPAKTTFTTATNAGSRPDQPKRMDLNKLKEAEEYRSKASKALKVMRGDYLYVSTEAYHGMPGSRVSFHCLGLYRPRCSASGSPTT